MSCHPLKYATFQPKSNTMPAAAAAKSLQSCLTLCNPIDAAHQAPPSLGFSRQEYWSGLPFPSPLCESEVAQSCPTLSNPMDCSLQPTRLPHPWDSPGKNTGVGCHFLLQCMKVKSESEVAQSCPTLSNPMDCSLQPTRLRRPWDSPGKSTGVGCHCLPTQA